MVQILLAAKANANVPLTVVNRFTPLHAAANAGCEDVVLQLCEARARLDQPTGDPWNSSNRRNHENLLCYIMIYHDCHLTCFLVDSWEVKLKLVSKDGLLLLLLLLLFTSLRLEQLRTSRQLLSTWLLRKDLSML